MGRNEKPIGSPADPVGSFAGRLRDRRARAGRPTYQAMAADSHYSHSVLADAAAGERLPTWPVTQAFVEACGADETEVAEWLEYWTETYQAAGNLRRRMADPAAPGRIVATGPGSDRLTRSTQLRPVQPALAEPEDCVPQPAVVRTYDDLLYQLQVLKIAAGNPSLRELRRLTGNAIAPSTLSEVLRGRRRPSFDQFMELVQALLSRAYSTTSLTDEHLQQWRKAWSQAEFNETRPDLWQRRRYGNIYLVTDQQQTGPTAEVVGHLPTDTAAALLASLDAKVAGQILSQMPPQRQMEVTLAMFQLTGGVRPTAPAAAQPRVQAADAGEPPAQAAPA
jgi:transcriptional regulator with XRE-family HTH domain